MGDTSMIADNLDESKNCVTPLRHPLYLTTYPTVATTIVLVRSDGINELASPIVGVFLLRYQPYGFKHREDLLA